MAAFNLFLACSGWLMMAVAFLLFAFFVPASWRRHASNLPALWCR
jgi:hypothetical protein